MKKQGFIVLVLAFAMVLASASVSFAGNHKSHKGHSPMKKIGKGSSLHCVLKGHDLSNPCPHLVAKGGLGEKYSLALPCDGKTSNQNPFSYNPESSSFFDLLNPLDYKVHNLNRTISFYRTEYAPLELSPLDPPPKLS
jgi:hypothetical protein